jgi:hypothetical protein
MRCQDCRNSQCPVKDISCLTCVHKWSEKGAPRYKEICAPCTLDSNICNYEPEDGLDNEDED